MVSCKSVAGANGGVWGEEKPVVLTTTGPAPELYQETLASEIVPARSRLSTVARLMPMGPWSTSARTWAARWLVIYRLDAVRLNPR